MIVESIVVLIFIAIHRPVGNRQQEVSTKTARRSQDLEEIKYILVGTLGTEYIILY